MNAENTSVELSTSSSNFPAMHRPIAILGAPSAIGLRLYDDGGVRRLDLAPDALRQRGLVTRLGAEDLGNVLPPNRYQDRERPVGRPRNEGDVETFSRATASGPRSRTAASGRFSIAEASSAPDAQVPVRHRLPIWTTFAASTSGRVPPSCARRVSQRPTARESAMLHADPEPESSTLAKSSCASI